MSAICATNACRSGSADVRHLLTPGGERQWDERADAMAKPGVDDAWHVSGSGQGPLADGGGQGLTGIQAGQFGGAHGAP